MKNQTKSQEQIKLEVEKAHKEIQPALYEYNVKSIETFGETEEILNSKILKITMEIKDQYPELSKYVEEMTITIPDEKNAQITLQNLKAYYDSLNTVLNNYKLEHPKK